MNRRRLALFLLLACLCMVVAACGGDDAAAPADDAPADDAPADDAPADDAPADDAPADDEPAEDEPAEDEGTDAAAAEPGEDWPDELVLGLVPSREADVIIDSADEVAADLTEALGVEVTALISQDYTGLTEAMASDQAHIGMFGPLGVVRAEERAGAEFVLSSERFESATYHTQYMTNDPDKYCMDEVVENEDGWKFCNGTLDAEEGPIGDEAIALIDDTIAYVDPGSASGYLIPALQLIENGVDLDSLESVFAGGHDNSVLSVNSGDVEVGLAFDDARSAVIEESPDVADNVVVFAWSEEIPNDGVVVAGALPEDLKTAITDEMLAYSQTEEGAEKLFEIYEIDALQPADPEAMDVIRRADEELGDSFEG